jgi:hypothetical protein
MTDQAREIAGNLTKAQRELMMRFDPKAEADHELLHCRTDDEWKASNALLRLGLCNTIWAVSLFVQITRLGLAVRAILQEQANAE